MKKILLPLFLSSALIAGCGTQTSTSISEVNSEIESVSTSERGVPAFSKTTYSYDKNAAEDLEMPVTLNGVNIFAGYFDGYKLSAKEMSYDVDHKVMVIDDEFMLKVNKGDHTLVVYYDDEIEPATLTISVMNSVTTEFDVATKKYAFGKTGNLKYDCDFSTATVKKLMKGDVEIPASYYSFSGNEFTIKEELLDRCYGTAQFDLYLSNNDVYTFNVETDIIFFTDYDISTIHSTVESIYGANPLYQYASSEHIGIVDGTEYGMDHNVLKYVPNNVPVDLDCNAIMTLADTLTTMSWYKLGYTKSKNYLISFDYMTVDSSAVAGQQFKFATTTTWGAPFTYQKDLLMGPDNDNVKHHFSLVLSGTQIQSGTFIYAKWLGGSGFLLLDNFRVTEIENPFSTKALSNYSIGSGNFEGNVVSNGWSYSVLLDGVDVNATINGDNFVIPSTVMKNLEPGTHKITYVTSLGNYEEEFSATTSGTANITEKTKSFSSTSTDLEVSGNFDNVTVTGAFIYGQNQYDVSHKNGKAIDKSNFTVSSSSLRINKNVLTNLYGSTTMKISFSNGETKTITLVNEKVVFKTDFNDVEVWCYDFMGGQNVTLCQDTAMTSFEERDGRNVLVYEPKNAVLGHSSQPGTYQNGILTFKRNSPEGAGTFWEGLDLDSNKQYKFTLEYEIEGENENVNFVMYRWMTSGSEEKDNLINPEKNVYTMTCLAGEFVGFYFYCQYTRSTDITNYKVIVKSFTVEAI